ncbi:MAG: nucleoid-associated protein [Saprospiraceae bacterium]|nr:nucleoid-associated protein [Saprospiraceae bacterium]
MLDFTDCTIVDVIAHQVGNQTNEEELLLSASLLHTDDARLRELLIQYFLYPFKDTEELYSFTFSDGDFTLNPLYQYASSIFSDGNSFQEKSESIATLLYEIAVHPQIKSGDLFVATFKHILMDGASVNALGLFKSETRQAFLQLDKKAKAFSLNYDDGINVDKLDKGCLIFDVEKENGYKICVLDKSNKSSEARYWIDFFLNISPLKTDYHQTSQFLGMTKQFVTKQLDEEFELGKADKIDLLNRSVDYFKKNETFDKQAFEEEVFGDSDVIASFRKFDQAYRQENEVELADSFGISAQAVKKQARVFKSVLKLDKNFHIYIHGDRELIEQGVDENGRKYYKIYYEQEA